MPANYYYLKYYYLLLSLLLRLEHRARSPVCVEQRWWCSVVVHALITTDYDFAKKKK